MQIELRGECTEKPSVRPADRDGEQERSLAERPIPIGLANERFARSQAGQRILREPHASCSASARRHDAPGRIENQEGFLVGKPLADGIEMCAQTAERPFAVLSIDLGQILSDDVRARRHAQRLEALVEP